MKKKLSCLLFVCFLVLVAGNLSALTFNPFKGAGRVSNQNLIMTGNTVEARLLADLAQYYTKQPLIVIHEDKVYYAAAGSRATTTATSGLMELVEYINPQRVIVLGGTEVLDRQYVQQVGAKYKVVVLDSANWENNASLLGELLDMKRLRVQFMEYMDTLRRMDAQRASGN